MKHIAVPIIGFMDIGNLDNRGPTVFCLKTADGHPVNETASDVA